MFCRGSLSSKWHLVGSSHWLLLLTDLNRLGVRRLSSLVQVWGRRCTASILLLVLRLYGKALIVCIGLDVKVVDVVIVDDVCHVWPILILTSIELVQGLVLLLLLTKLARWRRHELRLAYVSCSIWVVCIVDLGRQLLRRRLSWKQHLAWSHLLIWLLSLGHIRCTWLMVKLLLILRTRSCNADSFFSDLCGWVEWWTKLIKTFAHHFSTCGKWNWITAAWGSCCQKCCLFPLLHTFLRLHISIFNILLHLSPLKLIGICLHYLITFAVVKTCGTVYSFWLPIYVLIRFFHLVIGMVRITLVFRAIFKIFQGTVVGVIFKRHCRVEHFYHFTRHREFRWLIRWLWILRVNNLLGVVLALRLIVLNEANLCPKYPAWIFLLHLVLVYRLFYCWLQLFRFDLSMTHYRRWVVNIDKIVFVQVFNSQISIASACKVYPLEGGPDMRGWSIQIDSLLRFCVHECVAKQKLFTL